MKRCKKCQIEKDFSDFYKKGKYFVGTCKKCEYSDRRSGRLLDIDLYRERERIYRLKRAEKAKIANEGKPHGNFRHSVDQVAALAKDANNMTQLLSLMGYVFDGSSTRRRIRAFLNEHNIDCSHFSSRTQKYDDDTLALFAGQSTSFTNMLETMGLRVSGSSVKNIRRAIERRNIDISHFSDKRRRPSTNSTKPCEISSPKQFAEDLLSGKIRKSINSKTLRGLMTFENRPYICEGCGNDGTWRDSAITLEVDHIDGDRTNQSSSNLRYLCPNCHSQTETFGNKIRPIPQIENTLQ